MANPRVKKSGKKTKTETIKERAIYVYLPSHEMVTKWKDLAAKAGASISKFVIEHVENSLSQEEGKNGFTPRAELLEEIRKLREENAALKKRNKMLDTVIDRLEEEMKIYRTKPFLEEDFSGIREYETELIDLFKEKGEIKKNELLELLGIKSINAEISKGLTKQIENLERYGLIKDMGGKWKWKA